MKPRQSALALDWLSTCSVIPLRKQIAAIIAVLSGVDLIVFIGA